MKLTHEQDDICETGAQAVTQGANMVAIAFAGAGKTTTLNALAERIPLRGCYLAFNKAIADEARRKLARTRCTASTMHALAFSTVRDITTSPATLTARDLRNSGIMSRVRTPRMRGWNDYRIASAVCRAMAAYCNSDDAEITIDHATDALMQSTGDPDLIRVDEKAEQARVALAILSGPIAEMATLYWRDSIEQGNLSHDIYLKLLDLDDDLRAEAFRGFRYLMVDEAQDLNPVQRAILVKSGLPLIAVGDPYQQIYSWRGAENALTHIKGEIRYLTHSFRFGEEIAETARAILASRPDGGPAQRLVGAGGRPTGKHKGPRAAIICRTNIGMIEEALRVVGSGRKVHIDNVEKLIGDVRSAEALQCGQRERVTSQDLRQFDSWEELVAEAEESGGALSRLVQIVENNRVAEVESLGRAQVSGDTAEVMICTAHRAKGLEFPGVLLGKDWKDVDSMRRRHKVAQRETAKHVTLAIEEWNALYVAATRPILRLQGIGPILAPKRDFDPDEHGYVPPDWEPVE